MIDTSRADYPSDMLRAAGRGPERGQVETMTDHLLDSVTHYARENPTSAMLWALGVGFVLGWKLKPW